MRFINYLAYSTAHIIASFVLMNYNTTAMAGIFDFFTEQENIISHEKTIGAMIPLSGEHKNLGEMISRSIIMAWYDHAPENLKLVIYDTQSSREGTISSYNQAGLDNAQLIVGPLTGKNTKTVYDYNRENVINLSLSNNPYYGHSNIMIMGYTPQSQGIAISKILEHEDLNRAILLIPANEFGQGIIDGMNFFGNRRIVHTINYRPNTVDFTDLVKDLVEKKGDYNYDAIILPDGNPNTIRILAAQLAYYDTQDPYIEESIEISMGPNLPQQDKPNVIIEDRIPMIGGLGWQALNGAYKEPPLLNGYYIEIPSTPLKTTFNEKYQELYGQKPTPLAGLAYDTMAMSISSKKSDYPMETLRQAKGFSGISGIIQISDYGMVTRTYNVMKVLRNKNDYKYSVQVQDK